jgi:hypothetical protein
MIRGLENVLCHCDKIPYPVYTDMFSVLMTLFTAVLFVALVPGVLVTLPPGGSKLVVAFTHGVLFALLYQLTHKAVWKLVNRM